MIYSFPPEYFSFIKYSLKDFRVSIFSTNSFIFSKAQRFGRRLQPIFRQFVNQINHNKYNDTLDEI